MVHDVRTLARDRRAQREAGDRIVTEAAGERMVRDAALVEAAREPTVGRRRDQDVVAVVAQVRRERQHLGLAAAEAALRVDVQDAQAAHRAAPSRRARSSCFAYLRCT
jgi:hypothetical protein